MTDLSTHLQQGDKPANIDPKATAEGTVRCYECRRRILSSCLPSYFLSSSGGSAALGGVVCLLARGFPRTTVEGDASTIIGRSLFILASRTIETPGDAVRSNVLKSGKIRHLTTADVRINVWIKSERLHRAASLRNAECTRLLMNTFMMRQGEHSRQSEHIECSLVQVDKV